MLLLAASSQLWDKNGIDGLSTLSDVDGLFEFESKLLLNQTYIISHRYELRLSVESGSAGYFKEV